MAEDDVPTQDQIDDVESKFSTIFGPSLTSDQLLQLDNTAAASDMFILELYSYLFVDNRPLTYTPTTYASSVPFNGGYSSGNNTIGLFTPANPSDILGVLAHEIGHYVDMTGKAEQFWNVPLPQNPSNNSSPNMTIPPGPAQAALYLVYHLISEGRAQYNALEVYDQVQAQSEESILFLPTRDPNLQYENAELTAQFSSELDQYNVEQFTPVLTDLQSTSVTSDGYQYLSMDDGVFHMLIQGQIVDWSSVTGIHLTTYADGDPAQFTIYENGDLDPTSVDPMDSDVATGPHGEDFTSVLDLPVTSNLFSGGSILTDYSPYNLFLTNGTAAALEATIYQNADATGTIFERDLSDSTGKTEIRFYYDDNVEPVPVLPTGYSPIIATTYDFHLVTTDLTVTIENGNASVAYSADFSLPSQPNSGMVTFIVGGQANNFLNLDSTHIIVPTLNSEQFTMVENGYTYTFNNFYTIGALDSETTFTVVGNGFNLVGVGGGNVVDFSSTTTGVTVNLGENLYRLGAPDSTGYNTLSDIQIVYGSQGGDTLTGGNEPSVLDGVAGDDYLYTGAAPTTFVLHDDTNVVANAASRILYNGQFIAAQVSQSSVANVYVDNLGDSILFYDNGIDATVTFADGGGTAYVEGYFQQPPPPDDGVNGASVELPGDPFEPSSGIGGATLPLPWSNTPSWAQHEFGIFSDSQSQADPLVIDLTGAGLNLTALSGSLATFDYSSRGLSEPTGWIGSGTGLLVLPTSSGQVISGQQLFGPSTGNGFSELSALDSNHDGVINSSDSDWSMLEIWQDANGDGVEQPGELETLAQAGIASIGLNASTINQNNSGNTIVSTATVTFTNGHTSTIGEVDFAVDPLDSSLDSAASPAGATITDQIAALPWLKGHGSLYDLPVAASLDATLVQDLTNLENVSSGDFADFESDVTTVLYEWAGVTNVNPNSRGGNMDARQLETVEDLTGVTWLHYGTNNPGSFHPYVTAAWDFLFNEEELNLAVQTGFTQYLPGLTYDVNADGIEGQLDVPDAIAAQPANMSSYTSLTGELGGFEGWFAFLNLAETTSSIWAEVGGSATLLPSVAVSELFGGWFMGATSGTLPVLYNQDAFVFANGMSGTIQTASGSQVIDTGTGNVTVNASDGNKTIYDTRGGTAVLNLQGSGNTVYGGTGILTVNLGAGSAAISAGTGLATVNVSFAQRSNKMEIANMGGGSLIISGASVGNAGSDIGLSGNVRLNVAYGNSFGLKTITQGAGSATIATPTDGSNGTLVLDEDTGNDAFTFSSADPTYWVTGSGNDTASVTTSGLEIDFSEASTDYTVSYDGLGVVTVADTVGGTGTKTITLASGKSAELYFADGVKVGLGSSTSSTIPDAVQYGTSGNDTFWVNGGASYIDGGSGFDVVHFNMNSYGPDGSFQIGETSAGAVTINGTADGYNGTATLADVEEVFFGGYYYNLLSTAAGGGSLTINNATNGNYNIVVDGAGSDTLSFTTNLYNYWHAGAGTTAATLSAGVTDVYFLGGESQYTVAYNGTNTVTVTDSVSGRNGVKTLTLAGGVGELVFADGARVGLGNSASTSAPDAVQYGTSGNDVINVNGGSSYVDGGTGTDRVAFDNAVDTTGDGLWQVSENASGQAVFNGVNAGYDGTATLANVEQVTLVGSTYNLFVAPVAGGALTVNNPGNGYWSIDVDGSGNDTLSFTNNTTNYWHAGGGNDTATLSAGTTEILLAGSQGQYTVAYNGTNTVTVTDSVSGRNGTKTLLLSGGNGELVFADGSKIGLGNSQSSTIPDATQYGTNGNDTIWVDGGASTVDGGAGTDIVDFANSGSGVADGRWQVSETASGQVVINGVNAGYNGTATLADVEQVNLGGTTYNPLAAPAAGGSLTVSANTNLVVDGAGNDTLTFSGGSNYWHAGGGNDAVSLTGGTTEMYFTGAQSQYTVAYNSTNTVTVTDSVGGRNGTKTVTLSGGSGELVFGDGSKIGLGTSVVTSAPDSVQYGTNAADTIYVNGGTSFIDGGAGTDRLVFDNASTIVLDARWQISENAAGQAVFNGVNAGYDGTVTVADIEQVGIANGSYNLFVAPAAGGALTVNNPGNGYYSVVVDGSGNDTLSFTNNTTNYWHAGGGTDTATLSAGTTEIYFAGSESQYTVSYNGTSTVTVMDSVSGRNGTKTLLLSGGNGDLVFGDGSKIGIGNSISSTIDDSVQYGTSGNDTIWVDGGTSFVDGGAGTDVARINMNSVTPDGGVSVTDNALGQVVIGAAAYGYNGTATLADIEQVSFGNNYYNLLATAAGGGTLAINNASNSYYNVVADGAGSDTLSFTTGQTNYWHAGAGTTAATLSAGTTEIYFLGAESQYTVSYNGTNTVMVTDSVANRTGTKTITLSGGNGELVFSDGSKVGLGNSQSSTADDSVQYGTNGNDTIWVNGGTSFVDGGAGTDIVDFNSTSGLGPVDQHWQVSENASGQVVINGSSAGYNGTVTLADVEQVSLGGTTYNVLAAPVAGGSLTAASGTNLVVDSAGNDTLTFSGTGTNYWHASGGNDSATLSAGTTEIYFLGAESQYTISYNGTNTVTVTDSVSGRNGTKTLTLSGGNGELVFADGSKVGLGTSVASLDPDTVQYGTAAADTLALAGGTTFSDGGAGTDRAVFNYSTVATADAHWQVSENASGQVVINGTNAGYDGTATLADIEQVTFANTTYNLLTTLVAGGSLTVSANTNLVVDGAGNDTLTFSGGTNYWHAGGGNDAVSLTGGTTEMYFTGVQSQYTISYNGTNTVTVTDSVAGRNGTKTITMSGGSGELVFGDGSKIGIASSVSSSVPDAVQYGSSANDTFYATGGTSTINGGGGFDVVHFNTNSVAPDGNLQITDTASGAVTINGMADGYNGTATLIGVEEVYLGGNYYSLLSTAAGGGSLTINNASNNYYNIVADGAGTDTLAFTTSLTNYWHTGAGTTAATLSAGTTEIYFTGAESQYTVSYNGSNTLTVTDSVANRTGTKTITLSGGNGELVFSDGSKIGIGSSVASLDPDTVQYGTAANDTLYLNGGTSFIDGGAGTDRAVFNYSTVAAPDAHWQVSENASGQVVINGANAGYDGTATLADIEQVTLAGSTYNLLATPAAGGSLTVSTANTLVVDGAGNDALTFSSNGTNYWHTGAGTDTATLSSGTTEIYFTGTAADYTESYNGTGTLIVTNTNNQDNNGTKTLTLSGGNGELNFADGTKIGLGSSLSSGAPDLTQYGTSAADTLYVNGGTTYTDGGAGSDRVIFNSGTVNTPNASWLVSENGVGQVVINGNSAGYDGVATLADIEQVTLDGTTYNLLAAPAAGGSLSVTAGNNLVVDGTGNDALTFSSSGTNYWHAGGGTDTATLSAGTTNIYLTGVSSDYTITDPNSTTVVITDSVANRNGTKTLTLAGGSYNFVYGAGASGGSPSITGTSGNDNLTAAGTVFIDGGAGTDNVGFTGASNNVNDSRWSFSENASGQFVVNGANIGYDGTATLANVEQGTFGNGTFNLFAAPAAGGAVTVNNPGNGYWSIDVDSANNDTLSFTNNTTNYWHAAGGNDTATLSAGVTDVYFLGGESQYTVAYNGTNTVTVTDSVSGRNGVKTLTLAGGVGELVFADGARVGLGNSASTSAPDAVQYGTSGNDVINVNGGSSYVDGGTGTDRVAFDNAVDTTGDGLWQVSENASGQAVFNGVNAGYDGTATLANVEQVTLVGSTYNLFVAPVAGGALTVNNPGNGYWSIDVDGSGNDTLSFTNNTTNYWHAGGGNDTATLSAGTTEILLAGSQGQYTVAYNGTNTVTVTDSVSGRNGTKTLLLSGGNGELVFADGSKIGLGNSQSSTIPDATQYGTNGNDTIWVDGGASTVDGGAGTDIVDFANSGSGVADGRWQVSETASGQVVINGVNAGYNGTATLADVEQVNLGGTTYNPLAAPAAGGSLTVSANTNLVVDGAGNDTLTFSGGSNYWHAGGGNDAVSLTGGTTEMYFTGAQSQYTVAYNSTNTVTVTDSVGGRNGTKTVTLSGGSGELVFGDGSKIGLGTSVVTSAPDSVQYGTNAADTIYVNGGTSFIDGGAGTDRLVFDNASTIVLDARWQISENAAGQAVFNGVNAGYDGTVTVADIEQVGIANGSYNLFVAPAAGGALTVNNPGNGYYSVVVDGSGNDTLSFTNNTTNYWHAGGGTDTATLSAGTTEIYFAGAESQYTVAYNSSNTVTVTDSVSGRNGTKTLLLSGGNGDLVFADGSKVGLGASQSSTVDDSVQYGTSGNDTIWVNGGTSFVDGGAGTDIVDTNGTSGLGALDQRWQVSENASGQMVINGLNAGYNGTITLADVEQISISNTTYNVLAAPVAGGSLTASSGTNLVVDSAGNDTLTFSGGTNYWHASGGNDAISLTGGTTEIYFTGAQSQYTVSYNGTSTVVVADSVSGRNGTKTLTLSGGNGELVFADGSKVGLGNSQSSTADDSVQYGTNGNDTIWVNGGTNFVDGGAGTDVARINMNSVTPDGGVSVAETAAGQVVISASAYGYNGTATLADVEQVSFGNNYYNLLATAAGGGSLAINNASNSYYNVVVDGAGTDTLTFTTGQTNYWHAGAGTTAATLSAGTTEIYFAGAESQYTVSYNGTNTVVVTDSVSGRNGTKTLTLSGGNGELVFADGSKVGLGTSVASLDPDTVQYGTAAADTLALAGGTTFTDGGAGTDRAVFNYSTVATADAHWQVSENASGQVVINGTNAGYDGTATLADIEQVTFANTTYNLLTAPAAGGSLTVSANSNLVVDGSGNDTLTFSGGTNYWHAGGGNDAVSLTGGTTEMYFTGVQSQYTISYNGTNTVTVTDSVSGRNGTKTITMSGGSGELVFGDGSKIGIASSVSSSVPDTVQYGSSANDTFYATGGISTINGGGGFDVVHFNTNSVAPDGNLQVTDTASGAVTINGALDGYNGTATLIGVEEVYLGNNYYSLLSTAAGGGSLTINNATNNYYNIVADGVGTDTLAFTTSLTNYWHTGAGTTAATLSAGTTEIYFTGAESQYTVSYNGSNTLTVTDSVANRTGTKTITLSGGNGELVFGDGSKIGIGSSVVSSDPDTIQYGTGANDTLYLNGGTSFIDGGAGSDRAVFNYSTVATPDAHWQVSENASGQVVINGANAGYNGTATLTDVEQVTLAGSTYNLLATPAAGGSLTVSTANTLVVDGVGNDALTFSSNGTNYWHTGAGTDTATLSSGTTEIYFTGSAADYTESYNGTGTITVTNTSNEDNNGTKTITLNGGNGELIFADSTKIGLGTTIDPVMYGGSVASTLNGTNGNDTIYTGINSTVNGNGGTDTYLFGTGDGSVTLNNGISSNLNPTGQVDLLNGVSDQDLWFVKSGNNLVVDVLGTTDKLTVQNWYSNNYAQVAEFVDANGLKLDSALQNLVQAMATFSASNSAFNPQASGATMPTDTTLQNTIAASWHS